MTTQKPITHFGKWLEKTLDQHNISKDDLAKKMGVDRGQVYKWISSKERHFPKTSTFIFLVTALTILTGKEEKDLYDGASKAILKDN